MPELGIVRDRALIAMSANSKSSTETRFDAQPDWGAILREFPEWQTEVNLAELIAARFAPQAHGDMRDWQTALAALPELETTDTSYGPTVTASGPIDETRRELLADALRTLHPWRKGPFSLFGIHIDTEWRSDWKWQRVAPHLPALTGYRILDVGSGNGYFGWRMLEAGARLVVGVDPTLLFCMQHQAICRYLGRSANWVLPLRFEELPPTQFDGVFSMGVIYHRRDPLEHVDHLVRALRPGGFLVLESLVVEDAEDLVAPDRYARMRNVWQVPTTGTLSRWVNAAGLVDCRVVDVTATTNGEQRTTDWMRFESLAAALDPHDATRTVEGHPAPVRAIVIARKPV